VAQLDFAPWELLLLQEQQQPQQQLLLLSDRDSHLLHSLHLAPGSCRALSSPALLAGVPGMSLQAFPPPGSPAVTARAARLNSPMGLALGPGGSILFSSLHAVNVLQ
jgi:hypothetical protein